MTQALLLCPYLLLTERTTVGPWVFVPFRDVDDCDVPKSVRRPVARLIDAYRLHEDSLLGAVVHPCDDEIGAPIDRRALRPLGHAVMAGVVAGNPRMALPKEEQNANAGWAALTSENALLYGHPLGDGDSYVLATGVLVNEIGSRYATGDEPLPKVAPPVELPRPLYPTFDAELANGAYAVLTDGGVSGRRLHRALDWYRIALSNAEAVTLDVRVGAARSALEILTDAGDQTKRLVRRYGALMRTSDTTSAIHEEAFWAKGRVELTEDEWWVTRLCALRNAIVHGDKTPPELWEHNGLPQLNLIHDNLITALRIFVANQSGDDLLRLASRDRIFPRIAQRLARSPERLSRSSWK